MNRAVLDLIKKFKIGADKGSGGLWNNSPGAPGKDPLVLADKPFGEWNKFRIIQVGARTTIYLNDKLVVDNAILENYFDRTAAAAWAKLTSDAPVGRIRATVRAGRDTMRETLLSWLPQDMRGLRVLDAGCGTGALAMEGG